MFNDDPDLFYASTHQAAPGFFPETGKRSERGAGGNIVNVPLKGGQGSDAFRRAMTGTVLPVRGQRDEGTWRLKEVLNWCVCWLSTRRILCVHAECVYVYFLIIAAVLIEFLSLSLS